MGACKAKVYESEESVSDYFAELANGLMSARVGTEESAKWKRICLKT